jgi:uncharacterized protein (DUF433 family)
MATADTYPHVVLGADGEAFIEGTRYTVKHIAAEQYFYVWSAEEILRQHPDLRPAEVYAALAYFHDHHNTPSAAAVAPGCRQRQVIQRSPCGSTDIDHSEWHCRPSAGFAFALQITAEAVSRGDRT